MADAPFVFYKGWAEAEGAKAGAEERGFWQRSAGSAPSARKAVGNRGSNIDEALREGRIGVDAAMRIGASKPLRKTEDDCGDTTAARRYQ